MNYIEMWNKFILENKFDDLDYGVYEYDNDDIELLLNGKFKCEITPYDIIRKNDYAMPFKGDYNIVTDNNGNAICILKTVNVMLLPFTDIKENIALNFGYNSLKEFKESYKTLLEEELKEVGLDYSNETICVIEEFEIVYK